MIQYLQRKYRNLTGDKGFAEILTGTAWAMLSRVGTTILALVASLLITRMYGAEAMGILALVVSILSIVTVLTVLGTSTSILRLIPEHLVKYSATSAFRLYRKIQYLVAGVSIITGVMLFLLAPRIAGDIFKKPDLACLVAASAGFVLFKSLMQLNQQAVRGIKLIKTYAFLQLLPSLALVTLLLIGLRWRHPSLPAYAHLVAWAFTGIVGAIVMDRAFRRRVLPDDTVQPMPIRQILGISLPMLMTASMNIVISQTGIIILGMHRPAEEVGYYAVAVRLAMLTSLVLNCINTISAPTFSELHNSGRTEELLRVAKKSTRLIVFTTTPVLAVLLLSGSQLLRLFGPEFVVSYPAMIILIIGQFVHAISGSNGQFLNMTGNQNSLRNIMAITALINIIINLTLTPRLGILGPAIAACASRIIENASVLMAIYRRFGSTIAYVPFLSLYGARKKTRFTK